VTDDRPEHGNGHETPADRNVLDGPLAACSHDPRTGFLRDGHCRQHPDDAGCHEICAAVTEEFLEFSRRRGNDLVTPRPALDFPGLEPGDRWCLCVGRWIEARESGVAPPVVLEATNAAALERVPLETLEAHARDA